MASAGSSAKSVNACLTAEVSWSVNLSASLAQSFATSVTCCLAVVTLFCISCKALVTAACAAAKSDAVALSFFNVFSNAVLAVSYAEPAIAWSATFVGVAVSATACAASLAVCKFFCISAKSCCNWSNLGCNSDTFTPSFAAAVVKSATSSVNCFCVAASNLPNWSCKFAGISVFAAACFFAAKSAVACWATCFNATVASLTASMLTVSPCNNSAIFCLAVTTAGTSLMSASIIVSTAVFTLSIAVSMADFVPPAIALFNSPSESETNASFFCWSVNPVTTSLPLATEPLRASVTFLMSFCSCVCASVISLAVEASFFITEFKWSISPWIVANASVWSV